MLIADFTKRGEEITVDGLWMYDYGQKLQINGLDLPATFEVHFKWNGLQTAKIVTGNTINGVSMVDIPNETLCQKYPIAAYIYLSDVTEGETVNSVFMRVVKRVAPEGFKIQEDIDLFHYTLLVVNEYLARMQDEQNKAKDNVELSEAWAHGHKNYPDQEQDNAKFYAEAAKQVAVSTGFCHLAIAEDGHLYLSRTDNIEQSLNFKINEDGILEVEMS